MAWRACAISTTGILCAIFLSVGITLLRTQVVQTMIHNRVKKEITLTEKSQVFESWKNMPEESAVYKEHYFFDVTNPEVFAAGGKAAVRQIGPYTYRVYSQKENMKFLENGKISTHIRDNYVFVPEKSSGDPEVDIVRTVNIPYVAVMNKLDSYPYLLRKLVSFGMNRMDIDLFTSRTVHEMLWGYKDPLLSRIRTVKPQVDDHFGLMWKRNGTLEGEFVFHTGERDYMDFAKIDTWNGKREMSCWSSKQSNMINGTDGSLFHPLVSRNELLHVFAADLCRSIHLGYVEDVEVKGIHAYRFSPPADMLMNAKDNPANEGFCVPAGDCLGNGVLKVSGCQKGVPVVMSWPHFYQADTKYVDAVEGMNPSKEEHGTYVDLQPTTGIPIRAGVRGQVNILLKRMEDFPDTKDIKETIFPVMFVNLMGTIDDESASKMRTLLLNLSLFSNIPLLPVAIGVILLLVLILLIIFWQKKQEVKPQPFVCQQV